MAFFTQNGRFYPFFGQVKCCFQKKICEKKKQKKQKLSEANLHVVIPIKQLLINSNKVKESCNENKIRFEKYPIFYCFNHNSDQRARNALKIALLDSAPQN